MITRSSTISLNRHCNKEKLTQLFSLLNQSIKDEVTKLTNKMLYTETVHTLPNKEITDTINHHSSWVRQLIAKEASSNTRSIKNKIKKIDTRENSNIEKYQKELLDKYTNKELIINWNGNIQLDNRFLKIEDAKDTIFDYWIVLKWKGIDRMYIPIKINKHIKTLLSKGYELKRDTLKICNGNKIILIFRKGNVENTNIESIGIDIGRNKSFITSRNESENKTKEILNSLKKQKHGSKNKNSRVRKLKQTIDYCIKNDIEWDNLSKIYVEKLTNLKVGRRHGNVNHHWSYRYILNRIELLAEDLGVQVISVNPAYTSQICSSCGFKHKNNRKSEKFLCLSCENEMDADLNASINIHNRGINSIHDHKNSFYKNL